MPSTMNKLVKITINKILYIYSIVLLTAIIIVGFKNAKNLIEIIIPFLLIPVFLYFTGGFFKRNKKIKSILFVYSFICSNLILVIDLLSIRRFGNLILVFMLIPIPLSLILEFIKNKKSKIIVDKLCIETEKLDVSDDDKDIDESKRNFLKLLAGTGVTSFLLYILNPKKINAAFFGNGTGGSGNIYLRDSGGNKIDPAVNSPTDGFGICDIATVDTNNYYGYTDKNGRWYILKENSSGSSYQYASRLNNTSVTDGYATAWSGKSSLTYGNFNDAF